MSLLATNPSQPSFGVSRNAPSKGTQVPFGGALCDIPKNEKNGCEKDQGPFSRKSRRLFGPAHSVKLIFSYVVMGIKIKITAKFRDMEHVLKIQRELSKSFGTFEKRAAALGSSKRGKKTVINPNPT